MVAFSHLAIPGNSIFKAMKLQPSTVQIGLTVPTEDVSFQRFWEHKSALRGRIDIARFKVSSVIGHGAGGVVVKARLYKTTTVYALKSIPAETLYDGEVYEPEESNLARFITSSRVPFTAILLTAFMDSGLECLVTEIAYHGDLQSLLLRERGASLKDTLRWTVELTAALCTLHGHGIIHRDLKPTNILIDAERHVRLTDWGMAYWARRDDPEHWAAHKCIPPGAVRGVLGTKRYMSPEMLAGEAYDASIDWWALGVILYEIVVGRNPFEDEKGHVRTHLIIGAPVEIPQQAEDRYGDDAVSLIRALLNRDPQQRRGDRDIKTSAYFAGIDWDYLQGPFCDSNKVLKLAYSLLPHEDDSEAARPLKQGDSQLISCSSAASSVATTASCSSSEFSFTSDATDTEYESAALDDTSMVYPKLCESEHDDGRGIVLPILDQNGGSTSSATAVDSPTELSAGCDTKLAVPTTQSESGVQRSPTYLRSFAGYFGL